MSESYDQRFGGLARLYGIKATEQLQQSSVLVIGIGGVGSWIAEALARSGIGNITLMDMDDICVTNTNRQIHTTTQSIGQSKANVMTDRLRLINPEVNAEVIDDFLEIENLQETVTAKYDIVIDAIDSSSLKTRLVAHCKYHKIPVVTVGSAGGKKDPTKITYSDITKTTNDPLFASMRQQLRRNHNFSRNPKRSFGIEAIYSTEQMTYPDNQGETCQSKAFLQGGERLDCSGGYGASVMVTASFGLLTAARAIEKLIK